MATNKYFSQKVTSEQNLYEDLVIESLKIYGTDVYYLPRTIVNRDKILFDDIPSRFASAYKIEMYIENVDGFSGEGDLFQKFGIEIRDQATLIVSRRRWKQTVAAYNNEIVGAFPQEGDLIYIPMTRSIFQIMHVEKESPFYQLSNLPTVKLECELFEYNDEAMDTGIEDIDHIEELGYELKVTLNADSDVIGIAKGEYFTQTLLDGTIISAEVIEWDRSTQVLSLGHIGADDGNMHLFTVGGVITSSSTGTSRQIIAISEDLGDGGDQNADFATTELEFIDFSESNPFGDPT